MGSIKIQRKEHVFETFPVQHLSCGVVCIRGPGSGGIRTSSVDKDLAGSGSSIECWGCRMLVN